MFCILYIFRSYPLDCYDYWSTCSANKRETMNVVWILFVCFIQQSSFLPFPFVLSLNFFDYQIMNIHRMPWLLPTQNLLAWKSLPGETSRNLILKIVIFRNLVLPRLANHSDKFETHKATNSSFHFTTLAASQTTIPGGEYHIKTKC